MTTAEWTADAINMLLVVLIVCVSVAGIIAIKGFVGERMLRKRSIWFASVFGFLFMAYLVLHVLAGLNLLADWDALSGLREILPADWAQIFLVLGLVTVTGFYALMAFRQAGEMREQRLAMYKPRIIMESRGGKRGKYFMEQIEVGIFNDGGGAAINMELYIAHPVFKFDRFRYPHSITVGKDPITHDFHVEEPNVNEEPKVSVEPVALVVANYEDTSENPWHSTLELIWDANRGDVTPGRMQVARSRHHNTGGNGDD
jgi:hypothetical protein